MARARIVFPTPAHHPPAAQRVRGWPAAGGAARRHAGASHPPEAFGAAEPVANHYYVLKAAGRSALAWLNPESGLLERMTKPSAYGITPRNANPPVELPDDYDAVRRAIDRVASPSGAR